MSRKFYIIAFFVCASLSLLGCSSTKKIVSSGDSLQKSNNEVVTKLAATYSDWTTFSTSGKINIAMGAGQSFSSAMQLKMVNNKYILLSLRPILGIEAARIFITNDSIILIDKYHKAYIAEDIHSIAGTLPADLGLVQDIFLNRVFSLKDGTLSRANSNDFEAVAMAETGAYRISPRRQFDTFKYSFLINALSQLTQIEVTPGASTTHYTVDYADFTKALEGQLATSLSMQTVISKKDVNIGLEYNSARIKWNAPMDDQASINDGYRRITLNELVSLLKQM